jgi:predicted transcriptional regulator
LKRNREEIISQILNVCRNGAIKTRVVYQANLNFKTVEPYLDLLVKNNLLEVQQGEKKMYETTEKGETLLEALNQVSELSIR